MNRYYLIDDTKKISGVKYMTDTYWVKEYNKNNYGVFWTVNSFKSEKRTEANIESLDYWYVDIDSKTKSEQLERLNMFLLPTFLVETKNGHHAYWKIKNSGEDISKLQIYKYKKQLHNLVHYFNGDPNATDVTRILRVPNFYHMKDTNNPFLCKCLFENCNEYTADQMTKCFPSPSLDYKAPKTKELNSSESDSIFDKAAKINCIEALERLSGTDAVSYDTLTFRKTKKGRNIYSNGKTTSCWVDMDGYIGSRDNGGPTINQWLYWHHKSWAKVANYLKQYFPELEEK